jgi:hypothetical protein
MRLVRLAVVLLAIGLVATPAALAGTLTISELTQGADRIFRGTVMAVREEVEVVGDAKILTTTYEMRVDEAFTGSFDAPKGVQIAEVTRTQVFGTLPADAAQPASMVPELRKGQSYLLFTGVPSEQGLFYIEPAEGGELAVNTLKNQGLFLGATEAAMQPALYSELAGEIRLQLGIQE